MLRNAAADSTLIHLCDRPRASVNVSVSRFSDLSLKGGESSMTEWGAVGEIVGGPRGGSPPHGSCLSDARAARALPFITETRIFTRALGGVVPFFCSGLWARDRLPINGGG